VLKNGVFLSAINSTGSFFKERHDLPVYQADVRVFEVFDADASTSRFLLRLLQPTTRMAAPGCRTLSAIPRCWDFSVVYNVANFAKPAGG